MGSIEDLAEQINTCLEGNINKKKVRDVILAATYISQYISAEELICILGIPDKTTQMRRTLARMVKDNYIIEFPLSKQDAITRKLYYLSPKGHSSASALFFEPWGDDFKRRKRGLAPIHDYSVGINALSLLSINKPFTISKEAGFALSLKGKKLSGTLLIDQICIFKDNLDTSILFFEQDMGSEKPLTLIEKIPNYYAKRMIDDPKDSCLIFSFRSTEATATSDQALKDLVKYMDDNDIVSLYKARDYDPELVRKIFSDKGCIENDTLMRDLDIEDVYEYEKEANDTYSPIRYRQVHECHNALSITRYKGMARIMYRQYRDGLKEYMTALLNGYSIYTIPTTKIMEYMDYIMPARAGGIGRLEKDLSNIDSTIKYENLLSDAFSNKYGMHITLKNIFIGKRSRFALEYISRDLGAFIRCLFYKEEIEGYRDIIILMLIDSIDDAIFLSEMLDLYAGDRRGDMFFIMRDEYEPFLINQEREIIKYGGMG